MDPQCGVSTCPHLHIGQIPVSYCLLSYFIRQTQCNSKPNMNLEERKTNNMVYFKQFYLSRLSTHNDMQRIRTVPLSAFTSW